MKFFTKSLIATFLALFLTTPSVSLAQIAGAGEPSLSSPTVAAGCVNLKYSLSYGTKGTEVTKLQTFLKDKGYLPGSVTVTGTFGESTRNALRIFQLAKLNEVNVANIDKTLVPSATMRQSLADTGFTLTSTGVAGSYTRAKIAYMTCNEAVIPVDDSVGVFGGGSVYSTATDSGCINMPAGSSCQGGAGKCGAGGACVPNAGTSTCPAPGIMVNGVCTNDGDAHLVACTQDAYLCADGTWVGRTGTDCQFRCPTSALAKYQLYIDGNISLNNIVSSITKTDALAKCKISVSRYSDSEVRCVWNNQTLLDYSPTSATSAYGKYKVYFSDVLQQTSAPITRSEAYANCKETISYNTTTSIKCLWNGVVINSSAVNKTPTVAAEWKPSIISSGSAATLTWKSTNTSYCNVSHPGGINPWNNAPTSHTASYTSVTATDITTITCYNEAGLSATRTVKLTVTQTPAPCAPCAPCVDSSGENAPQSTGCVVPPTSPTPTVTVAWTPSTITSGSPATLTWSSTNASYCNVSHPGGINPWNNAPTSHTAPYTSVTANDTTTITCYNQAGQSASKTVTLTVAPVEVAMVPKNASCVGISGAPSSVTSGQSFQARITMKNTGSTPWLISGASPSSGIKLGSQNPENGNNFKINRIGVNSKAVTGTDVVFSGTFKATTTVGTYNFDWRMVDEYVEWFGETCHQSITVTPPTSGLYNFVAADEESCNSSVLSRFGGLVKRCTIGGSCGLYCGKPGISCASANPTVWGSCIDAATDTRTSSSAVLGVASMCVNLPINLIRGAESPSVSLLQSFLLEKGFMEGEVTGFYGDKTVEAVKDYQASVGLPTTGMVYDFTREAMRAESCQ
jgi:peptidoglycan hydrolase-like protein with peptidoglycan-binding domain